MFLDGLDPTIQTLVSRHRGDRRKPTYPELVQIVQAERDALRSRRGIKNRPHNVFHLDAMKTSLSVSRNDGRSEYDKVKFMQNEAQSLPTTELPSMKGPSTGDTDPVMYAGNHISAVPVPYAS